MAGSDDLLIASQVGAITGGYAYHRAQVCLHSYVDLDGTALHVVTGASSAAPHPHGVGVRRRWSG
jgi:hypothetical protein